MIFFYARYRLVKIYKVNLFQIDNKDDILDKKKYDTNDWSINKSWAELGQAQPGLGLGLKQSDLNRFECLVGAYKQLSL